MDEPIKTAIAWMKTESIFNDKTNAMYAGEIADQAAAELAALRQVVRLARCLVEQYQKDPDGAIHYEGDVPVWEEVFSYPVRRNEILTELAAALARVDGEK